MFDRSAYYTDGNSSSPNCPYTCNNGYYGQWCVSLLKILVDAFGGPAGFAMVILSLLLALLISVAVIWHRKVRKDSEKVAAVQLLLLSVLSLLFIAVIIVIVVVVWSRCCGCSLQCC